MAVERLGDLAGHRRTAPLEFWGIATWGVAVTATHFLSMGLTLYTAIPWWDLFVHAASGFGVAGIFYLLFSRESRHPVALWLTIPLVVLAVGTWFEVYERFLSDFWVNWTLAYYWTDTVEDLVADTAGAVVFSAVLWVRFRLDG